MPPPADDPPSDWVSPDQPSSAAPAETAPAETAPGEPAEPARNSEMAPGAPPDNAVPPAEPRRRRRRRRRRPPREIGPGGDAQGDYRGNAAPAGESAAENAVVGDAPSAAPPQFAASEGAPAGGEVRERPRRRRRRRRPSPAPGSGAAATVVGGEAATPTSTDEGETAAGEPEAGATVPGPGTLRLRTRFSRREMPRRRAIARPGLAYSAVESGDRPSADGPANAPRRENDRPRRRRPSPPASGETAASEAQSADGVPAQPDQRQRNRGPRYRRPADQRARPGEPPQLPGASERPASGRSNRDAHRSGPAGPRDGQGRDRQRPNGQRGRAAPVRRIEQKLYALESTVDRGFEDVADEAEESGTRRVHWVIVKRTVADQKSGKPMSATYVLQRDGAETDFPNLGAARAAANKTIIHPEKLTLSKAEHVAAKSK